MRKYDQNFLYDYANHIFRNDCFGYYIHGNQHDRISPHVHPNTNAMQRKNLQSQRRPMEFPFQNDVWHDDHGRTWLQMLAHLPSTSTGIDPTNLSSNLDMDKNSPNGAKLGYIFCDASSNRIFNFNCHHSFGARAFEFVPRINYF